MSLKILLVDGDDGYEAMIFEKNYTSDKYLELWNQAREDEYGWITITVGEDDTPVDITALEFEGVTLTEEFAGWIKNDLLDYDTLKDKNFFVIKE